MTPRTRNLTIGGLAVVVIAWVAAAVFVADDDPPLAVTFLRYEGADMIALQSQTTVIPRLLTSLGTQIPMGPTASLKESSKRTGVAR